LRRQHLHRKQCNARTRSRALRSWSEIYEDKEYIVSVRTKTEPPTHTTHICNNQSSRNGQKILAVAVHSTESLDIPHSIKDLTSLDSWFDNPASDASAHVGVDGDGQSRMWVHSDKKAWAILVLNGVTFNIEFIAKASQKRSDWEDVQIKEGARWAAYICLKYDLPASRGKVAGAHGQAWIEKKGIIRHKDLTDVGVGTHEDPGPTFPMTRFIELTQYYKDNGWVL
jgi:N-acetyl-anhydromuramyl-L-alanine amidase AmpD